MAHKQTFVEKGVDLQVLHHEKTDLIEFLGDIDSLTTSVQGREFESVSAETERHVLVRQTQLGYAEPFPTRSWKDIPRKDRNYTNSQPEGSPIEILNLAVECWSFVQM